MHTVKHADRQTDRRIQSKTFSCNRDNNKSREHSCGVSHNRTTTWELKAAYATTLFNRYPCLPHYKSPTALSHMHHLTCGISSLLYSVNLILFTVLLVHLILCISPHHSHHLRSRHLSLPQSFAPDLKLISYTNPFLHSILIPSEWPTWILNLY